jgi:hypothetical protein
MLEEYEEAKAKAEEQDWAEQIEHPKDYVDHSH